MKNLSRFTMRKAPWKFQRVFKNCAFIALATLWSLGLLFSSRSTPYDESFPQAAPRSNVKSLGEYELTLNQDLRLFTFKKKPIMWVYWDNLEKLPPYIRISLHLLFCHNQPNVHVALLDEKFVIKHLTPHLHKYYFNLIQPHKADYLRCYLLLVFGGIYVDADVVQLRSITHMFQQLKTYDFITFEEPSAGPVACSLIGPIVSDSLYFRLWKNRVDNILSSKFANAPVLNLLQLANYPIEWTEILKDILKFAFLYLPKNFRVKKYEGLMTYDQLTPILDNNYTKMYFEVDQGQLTRWTSLLNTRTEFILYHHHPVDAWIGEDLKKQLTTMSVPVLRSRKTLLNYLFNISMSRCHGWETVKICTGFSTDNCLNIEI